MSYPGDWASRRRLVFLRDGYQCHHCGEKGGRLGAAQLECHHIVPKRMGGADTPDNLTTLCRQCHTRLHREDDSRCLPPNRGPVIAGSSLAVLPRPVGEFAAGVVDTTATPLTFLCGVALFSTVLADTNPAVMVTTLVHLGSELAKTTAGVLPWVVTFVSVQYIHSLKSVVREYRRQAPSPSGRRLSWFVWGAIGLSGVGLVVVNVSPYVESVATLRGVGTVTYLVAIVVLAGALTERYLSNDKLSDTAVWRRVSFVHVVSLVDTVVVLTASSSFPPRFGFSFLLLLGVAIVSAYRSGTRESAAG